MTYHQFKKGKCIDYLGGVCVECDGDYRDRPEVYQFDHLKQKKSAISTLIVGGTAWKDIKLELNKCELVCSNCHAEIHAGLHPQYSVQDGEADSQDDTQLGLFEQECNPM